MLLKIASRNIWRSKKRSLIIIAAVGIGVWAGIFLIAFYNGMIEQRINLAINREFSHVQLHHAEFKKEYDIKYYLPNGNHILEEIKNDTRVKAAAGRVIIKGMIASPAGTSGIILNGIMPAEEKLVTGIDDKISTGNYFTNDKHNEIMMSERLCKKLKLSLNKKVILTFQDIDGNLATGAFRITAIFKTINGPYDDVNVFVEISDIDSLAGIKNDMNEIAVLLISNTLLEQYQTDLQQKLPDVEIMNWMKIAPEIGLTVSVGSQMAYFLMGIILLALAFGIINTMMMAVLERTREIGMLLALGMNKFKIFIMILMETFFLILAGCPGGMIMGFISIKITQHRGIDLSKYSDVYSTFGYEPVIYPTLTLQQFGVILLLIFITALFSSLFPARRALRLKPAESLKK